jgi:hypothetical protein
MTPEQELLQKKLDEIDKRLEAHFNARQKQFGDVIGMLLALAQVIDEKKGTMPADIILEQSAKKVRELADTLNNTDFKLVNELADFQRLINDELDKLKSYFPEN